MAVEEQTEKIRITGKTLPDLLDEKFYKELKKANANIETVSLVLIYAKDKQPIPIMINHENNKEIEDKILHIACNDPQILSIVKKVVKGSE